jgi:hypothetical protein
MADNSNAFNNHTHVHLVNVPHAGCEQSASLQTLPQDACHNKPIGWDVMYGHLQAHYGINGSLKYYSQGETLLITSKTGVQQGGLLGSLLFTMSIHLLLSDIGRQH